MLRSPNTTGTGKSTTSLRKPGRLAVEYLEDRKMLCGNGLCDCAVVPVPMDDPATATMTTKVYDVSDLEIRESDQQQLGEFGERDPQDQLDFEELIDLITSATDDSTDPSPDDIVARVYPVGDLVIPPTPAPTGGTGGFGRGFAGNGNNGGFSDNVQPDFGQLINLVVEQTDSEVTDDSLTPNTTNNSADIADLLAKLRRLQDLQVSIEVRFITVTDNFFNEIGVDFDLEGQDDNNEDGFEEDQNVGQSLFGTTIQPQFNSTSVATMVSVPDGGTILLGGIGRPSNAANDGSLPFLNKLPYVSRLFLNPNVTPDTRRLTMMVTPRIIIAEEE